MIPLVGGSADREQESRRGQTASLLRWAPTTALRRCRVSAVEYTGDT